MCPLTVRSKIDLYHFRFSIHIASAEPGIRKDAHDIFSSFTLLFNNLFLPEWLERRVRELWFILASYPLQKLMILLIRLKSVENISGLIHKTINFVKIGALLKLGCMVTHI
jgi:hypothetical protein